MRSRIAFALGLVVLFAFLAFSYAVKDTEVIWLQTRALGLLSYLFLFLSLNIGIIKMLTKGIRNFEFFRLHIPSSVAAVIFTFTHFISVFLDNYKWGKQLTATQYLGLSFSDYWVSLLSIGVLTFYIMILVTVTSPPKFVRFIGFRSWKAIHILSYIAFFMAYIHSVNLGTDIKTSFVAPLLSPLVFGSFIFTVGLLAARVMRGVGLIHDLTESGLVALFVILLILMSSNIVKGIVDIYNFERTYKNELGIKSNAVEALELQIGSLKNDTIALRQAISEVGNG